MSEIHYKRTLLSLLSNGQNICFLQLTISRGYRKLPKKRKNRIFLHLFSIFSTSDIKEQQSGAGKGYLKIMAPFLHSLVSLVSLVSFVLWTRGGWRREVEHLGFLLLTTKNIDKTCSQNIDKTRKILIKNIDKASSPRGDLVPNFWAS